MNLPNDIETERDDLRTERDHLAAQLAEARRIHENVNAARRAATRERNTAEEKLQQAIYERDYYRAEAERLGGATLP